MLLEDAVWWLEYEEIEGAPNLLCADYARTMRRPRQAPDYDLSLQVFGCQSVDLLEIVLQKCSCLSVLFSVVLCLIVFGVLFNARCF